MLPIRSHSTIKSRQKGGLLVYVTLMTGRERGGGIKPMERHIKPLAHGAYFRDEFREI